MNEGKLRLEVERGNKAEQLLKNPIFVEVFDLLEKRYVEELINTKSSEHEKRERCYNAIRALGHVEQHIRSVSETGVMAAQQINEMLKPKY